MFYHQKAVITYTFNIMRHMSAAVALSQKIKTISHKLWQSKRFQIPKALHLFTIKILKKRLKIGVI